VIAASVVKEFLGLEAEMERLGGSTGVAEYYRILRQHGVDHPKRFKASRPGCAPRKCSDYSRSFDETPPT
jgi:hypothetical protein